MRNLLRITSVITLLAFVITCISSCATEKSKSADEKAYEDALVEAKKILSEGKWGLDLHGGLTGYTIDEHGSGEDSKSVLEAGIAISGEDSIRRKIVELESQMEVLSNPPERYKGVYDDLLLVYSAYMNVAEIVLHPADYIFEYRSSLDEKNLAYSEAYAVFNVSYNGFLKDEAVELPASRVITSARSVATTIVVDQQCFRMLDRYTTSVIMSAASNSPQWVGTAEEAKQYRERALEDYREVVNCAEMDYRVVRKVKEVQSLYEKYNSSKTPTAEDAFVEKYDELLRMVFWAN